RTALSMLPLPAAPDLPTQTHDAASWQGLQLRTPLDSDCRCTHAASHGDRFQAFDQARIDSLGDEFTAEGLPCVDTEFPALCRVIAQRTHQRYQVAWIRSVELPPAPALAQQPRQRPPQ